MEYAEGLRCELRLEQPLGDRNRVGFGFDARGEVEITETLSDAAEPPVGVVHVADRLFRQHQRVLGQFDDRVGEQFIEAVEDGVDLVDEVVGAAVVDVVVLTTTNELDNLIGRRELRSEAGSFSANEPARRG